MSDHTVATCTGTFLAGLSWHFIIDFLLYSVFGAMGFRIGRRFHKHDQEGNCQK